MPIRFRCAYCNQLLGIAHRKAGTVVRCPTCAGQVIVPNVDSDETEAPGSDEPLVFERSDFEDLLNPETAAVQSGEKKQAVLTSGDVPVKLPSPTEPPAGAWGTHAEPAFDVERINPAPLSLPAAAATRPDVIVLTRSKATIYLVLAVVALALTFGGGWLLGYFMRPS
jgi:hypothetical protein